MHASSIPPFVARTYFVDRILPIYEKQNLGGCTVFKDHENFKLLISRSKKFLNHYLRSLRKQFVTCKKRTENHESIFCFLPRNKNSAYNLSYARNLKLHVEFREISWQMLIFTRINFPLGIRLAIFVGGGQLAKDFWMVNPCLKWLRRLDNFNKNIC